MTLFVQGTLSKVMYSLLSSDSGVMCEVNGGRQIGRGMMHLSPTRGPCSSCLQPSLRLP